MPPLLSLSPHVCPDRIIHVNRQQQDVNPFHPCQKRQNDERVARHRGVSTPFFLSIQSLGEECRSYHRIDHHTPHTHTYIFTQVHERTTTAPFIIHCRGRDGGGKRRREGCPHTTGDGKGHPDQLVVGGSDSGSDGLYISHGGYM